MTTMASSSTATTTLNQDTPEWKRHACSVFLAGDEVVEIVPSFSIATTRLELLTVPKLPLLQAGVPSRAPLWLALLLEKRNLCKIQSPEWMSVENLRDVLKWEQTQELFSPLLPFYWQPISRSLMNNLEESCKILLQDIAEVRRDKIRRNLHTLSQQALSQNATLPIIDVTGIGALELAFIHSFVKTAFSNHMKLSQPESTTVEEKSNRPSVARGKATGDVDASDDEENEEEDETAAPSTSRRLRRFQ